MGEAKTSGFAPHAIQPSRFPVVQSASIESLPTAQNLKRNILETFHTGTEWLKTPTNPIFHLRSLLKEAFSWLKDCTKKVKML